MNTKLPTGITLTPSGTYQSVIHHRNLPKGRLFRNFKTLADAVRGRELLLKQLDNNTAVAQEPRHVQISTVLLEYLEADNAKIAKTDRALVFLLQRQLTVVLKELDIRWVENWVRDMKCVDNLAPSTIRRKVECVARALDWWNRTEHPGLKLGNPFRDLPRGYSTYGENDKLLPGRAAKRDVERDRRLLPGEDERIEAAINNWHNPKRERPLNWDDRADFLMIYRLIVNTGLRLREAYTLRLEDLRLDERYIFIRPGKTGRSRTVPVTRQLEGWIRDYLKDHSKASQLSDPIFPFWGGSLDEKALTLVSRRVSARFSTLFSYAECEDLREHDLRHEATCRWMMKRKPDGNWLYRAEEVRRITGHKSVQVFERYLSLRGCDLAAELD